MLQKDAHKRLVLTANTGHNIYIYSGLVVHITRNKTKQSRVKQNISANKQTYSDNNNNNDDNDGNNNKQNKNKLKSKQERKMMEKSINNQQTRQSI